MMDAARLVSTATLREIPQSALGRLEAEAARVQQELSSGRPADIGLLLGSGTGIVISVRQEQVRLAAIKDSNALVGSRLDASQAALTAILQDAQDMLGAVLAGQRSAVGADVLAGEARAKLSALVQLLSTTIDNTSVFGGLSTDSVPLADYFGAPQPASRSVVAAAFSAEFGMTQSDPNVLSISASQMKAFIDGPFTDLFDNAGWAANWSSASDLPVRSRISKSELIDTSVSANAEPFRQIVQAYVMVADLGGDRLNEGAMTELYGRAAELIGESVKGLGEAQSKLGIAQERIQRANERLDIEAGILRAHADGLEAVDPAELATRLSNLTSQIELAYALTARVHRLSLLEFI
jgi:flagellar hook-associated protein 3 FlgL